MTPQSVLRMIEELDGQNAIKIVQILNSNKNITDERIAELADLKLNKVRKVLYKLKEQQIATCWRERDSKTGWFVYFWSFRQEKLNIFIYERQKAVLRVLKQYFDYVNQNDRYTCENKCQKFVFDDAFNLGFSCPICGSLLVQFDSKKQLKILKRKIHQLSNLIKDFETK